MHQSLMCTLKEKTLAYIVNVIPIMSERAQSFQERSVAVCTSSANHFSLRVSVPEPQALISI